MVSILRKPKLLILAVTASLLLLASSWVSLHSSRLLKAERKLDQASRLIQQAAPAPWSRTERNVATLQQYVRDNPKSARNRTLLGAAYLQKARETGDPSYLGKAEELFKKALELDGKDFEAMAGMGSLSLSRHQFWDALRWGERGLTVNPWSPELHGVVGDACVELGEYDRAVKTFQRMVDLKPQLSAYSRVSYVRELYGDTKGAIEAMSMAVSAGAPNRENTAWCQVQLGHLYFNEGNYPMAELEYQMALKHLPKYVHALAGLARLRVAQNKLDEGVRLYEEVVGAMPLPEYVIALGDLYEGRGKSELAKRQYDLVLAMQELYRANGVDTEMEMALFEADHDLNIPAALEQAKKQIQKQANIKAADVLAWTLYKSGQYDEAQSAIQKALRLGTKEPLFLYHAGMIHYKAGQKAKAKEYLSRVLALNPQFSVRHAPVAKRALEELRQSS
jgi:tetratricopeptide (TPR) repeat protein